MDVLNDISHEKICMDVSKKRKPLEITESILIAALGNANIKARIDKMQQNGRCRLCGDRDETINHMIS